MDNQNKKSRTKNKEKSKDEFLNAVGEILKTKGFNALKINDIAKEANLDKKLIYNYFGGSDQLLDEYIQSRNYWGNVKHDKVNYQYNDGGKSFAKQVLHQQFDYGFENKEFLKIILWQLSEERDSLKKMKKDMEANGEVLFNSITDDYFEENATKFRSIAAILVSGIYYLNLFSDLNKSTFCGIDIESEEGKKSIKEAIDFILDKSYEELKK